MNEILTKSAMKEIKRIFYNPNIRRLYDLINGIVKEEYDCGNSGKLTIVKEIVN